MLQLKQQTTRLRYTLTVASPAQKQTCTISVPVQNRTCGCQLRCLHSIQQQTNRRMHLVLNNVNPTQQTALYATTLFTINLMVRKQTALVGSRKMSFSSYSA